MSKDKKMKIEIENIEAVTTHDLQIIATSLLSASAVFTGKQRGIDDGDGISPAEALGVATIILVKTAELAGDYFSEDKE